MNLNMLYHVIRSKALCQHIFLFIKNIMHDFLSSYFIVIRVIVE